MELVDDSKALKRLPQGDWKNKSFVMKSRFYLMGGWKSSWNLLVMKDFTDDAKG